MDAALSVVDRLYFVGLQEEWAVSALLLARLMNASSTTLDQHILSQPIERGTGVSGRTGTNATARSCTSTPTSTSPCMKRESRDAVVNDYSPESKQALLHNSTLTHLAKAMNAYDIALYEYGMHHSFVRLT